MRKIRRRTIQIDFIKSKANYFFENSKEELSAERLAIQSFVTTLLAKAGAYRGFNYLYWLEKGAREWIENGSPEDKTPFLGDQTRIKFY